MSRDQHGAKAAVFHAFKNRGQLSTIHQVIDPAHPSCRHPNGLQAALNLLAGQLARPCLNSRINFIMVAQPSQERREAVVIFPRSSTHGGN